MPYHLPMVSGGIVLFDVDGGLADMSMFAKVLAQQGRSRGSAWQEFFSHFPEARSVEAGRRLVTAAADLGFSVVYSTTRPAFASKITHRWLADNRFPGGVVLGRPEKGGSHVPAVSVKLSHCGLVRYRARGNFLAAFVDDESEVVDLLRQHGFAGRSFKRLLECETESDLHTALAFGPRGLNEKWWSRNARLPITAALRTASYRGGHSRWPTASLHSP